MTVSQQQNAIEMRALRKVYKGSGKAKPGGSSYSARWAPPGTTAPPVRRRHRARAFQSVALPMVQDFGWTKEIEDRLLAPVPIRLVAAEKSLLVCFRAFSSLALFLGTAIQAQQIGLLFGVILAPMIFFGCAYYPWQGLSVVPAMKYAVLVNPLVYVAEGMRGALTPAAPHMALPLVVVALLLITAFFWRLGMKFFMKRAVG